MTTTGQPSTKSLVEELNNKASLLVTKDLILSKITPIDVFNTMVKNAKRIGGAHPKPRAKSGGLIGLYAVKALLKIKMHQYYKHDDSWGIGPAATHVTIKENYMEAEMRQLQYQITSEEDNLFAHIERTFNKFNL